MAPNQSDATSSDPVFQLLVLADFCGASEVGENRPKRIDKVTFDEVMAHFSPDVQIKVDDHLSGGQVPLDIELTFRSMRDFHPSAILKQAAALRGYFAACQVLTSVARGEINGAEAVRQLEPEDLPDHLRRSIEAAVTEADATAQPSGKPAPAEQTEDIFASVNMPTETPKKIEDTVGSLIQSIGIPREEVAKSPQRRAASQLLENLCRKLHAQLDAVLHHSALQSIESTWRGLQLLVSRTDFQEVSVVLHVAHARRDSLNDGLPQAIQHVEATASSDGIDVVLIDFEFDQTAGDLALLRSLAEIGEQFYCLVVTSGSKCLLGVPADADYSDLPRSLSSRFDESDLIEWREFRQQPQAESLAVVLPNVAARVPYGSKTVPVREIAYEEKGPVLWTRGAWAVGAAMVQSVARTGWAVSIAGDQDGRVDDLPVVQTRQGTSEVHSCAETVWTDEQLQEVARAGFVVLSARPNQNRLAVVSVPTLYDPPATSDRAEARELLLHATVPFRVFATRVGRRLATVQGKLAPAMADGQIENILQEALDGLFSRPACVSVVVAASEEEGQAREVHLEIRPDFSIMGREPELTLGFVLPG